MRKGKITVIKINVGSYDQENDTLGAGRWMNRDTGILSGILKDLKVNRR